MLSEILAKILQRLPKMIYPLGISLKSLIHDFLPINKTTHMDSSWKQSILAIEVCSLCCIVGMLLDNADNVYVHCSSGKRIVSSLKSAQLMLGSHHIVREMMGIISRLANDKAPIIDIWFQSVFWAPMLRASYLFRLFLESIASPSSFHHNYLKFRPVVSCLSRELPGIFSTWTSCLCTMQLYPNLASPQEVGVTVLCTCMLRLFDSKEIASGDIHAVTTSILSQSSISESDRSCPSASLSAKYHQLMFSYNRFGDAFEDAVSKWEIMNNKQLCSDDLLRKLELSSFETSIPLLAYFFRALSQLKFNGHTTKEVMWKDHNKLMGDLKRCTHVLLNSSVQAKSFDRVKRLSEVKAINSLLAGEMSRVLSIDDIRILIKEFASQIQTVFDIRSKADRDLEKMSIVRYFPLYVRAISSTAFSTKICEWRCLLSGLSIHLKENREDSKIYDVMDNIVCSLLISLILPADTPSYSVIQNNASGYLHLLKVVQARASWSPSSPPPPPPPLSMTNKNHEQFTPLDRGPNSAQAKLDAFLDYLLYNETSFIDAMKDTKKIDYQKDIPNGINLQTILILKLLRVERIMRNVRSREGTDEISQPAISALLEHMPTPPRNLQIRQGQNLDINCSSLPLSEDMILSTISAIILLISQIFRMTLGESSNAVVHIIPYRQSENSIRDLLDRIMGADEFMACLLCLTNVKSKSDDQVPFQGAIHFVSSENYKNSLLYHVLPSWKSLMRQFSVILMSGKYVSGSDINNNELPDSHTAAFLRSMNEIIRLFKSRCTNTTSTSDVSALIGLDVTQVCGPCSNNCVACRTSCHKIQLIQKNVQNAERRMSIKKDEGKNVLSSVKIGKWDQEMTAKVQRLMTMFQ